MADSKKLDYLFITWGKPFNDSSGAVNKQIYFLANSLVMNGNKVGILYISFTSVSALYKFDRANNFKTLAKKGLGKLIYTKILSRPYIYILRKRSNNILNPKIQVYISNYKIPKISINRIVTSYWWAILLTERYGDLNNVYFILYHDYSKDIRNSNVKNIEYLEKAYEISKKILANPILEKQFDENTPLIMEGINLKEYECKGDFFEKDKNTILVPLRKNPVKGASYAVDALKLIHEKYDSISIVAFGDYNKPLPDYITFHRNITQSELKKLYCRSTFFILPSIEEGIPEPLIEAMVAGCISISTRCGGPETIINAGKNGFLVSIKNSMEIFQKFQEIMNSNIELEEISDLARQSAMTYDINKTYKEFIQAIDFYESKEKR
jgi:glycosyltransferase involved in cell wall biosynthesis